MEVFRADSRRSQPGPSEWFTGQVWLQEIVEAPTRLRAYRVTFSSGCPDGVAQPSVRPGAGGHVRPSADRPLGRRSRGPERRGRGLVEPAERHWHGATEDGPMVHLALQEADDQGVAALWGEHVSDEDSTR